LTEGRLHAWWRSVKEQASRRQWEEIADITFHDLRHDFAHRARQAGWSLEEIAYYLGHTTKKGSQPLGPLQDIRKSVEIK
jgi:integrase